MAGPCDGRAGFTFQQLENKRERRGQMLTSLLKVHLYPLGLSLKGFPIFHQYHGLRDLL